MGDDATAAYAAALRDLWEAAARPTGQTLQYQAGQQKPPLTLGVSSWSDWFNGRNVPANPRVAAFLIAYLRGRVPSGCAYQAPPDRWWETRRSALAQRRTGSGRGGRPRSSPRPAYSGSADGPFGQLQPTLTPEAPAFPASAGLQRAEDADPFLLGVHEPIGVDGAAPRALPAYVARDVDSARDGVRARLRAMAARGGFLLLVGDSSVGKSRTAFEAVRAELGDWPLLHPAGAVELDTLAAGGSGGRLVVWLDELQTYLDTDSAGGERRPRGATGPRRRRRH
ncbi:hypothetical protein [Frankia sp. AiPa1]|uniref:hypothetical protein n=1 Tax=Frankia sp. AiPa1 TaxID=573492 RepID=UPI00202B6D73|nr:hypothetical protein [Frankia sp. AiPa1]MCL9759122.1 hypothetical protein [Frankia sp. AiPa1]